MAQARLEAIGVLSGISEGALVGVTDLLVIDGPAGPTLLSSTRGDGQLTAFAISSGIPNALDEWYIAPSFLQLESTDLAYIRQNGQDRVMLAGLADDDLAGVSLTGTGLGSVTMFNAPGTDLGQLSALSILESGGDTEWGLGALRGGGLTLLDFSGGSQITSTRILSGTANFDVRASAVATLQYGSQSLAFAAYATENKIVSMRIDSNGTVTLRDEMTDESVGAALASPIAIKTVEVGGKIFVLVAASGSGGLSVFEVAFNGDLTLTDTLLDTRDTRFADAAQIETITIDGRVFVAAAGSDRGISLLTLTPGGQLHHIDTAPAALSAPLNGITDLALAEVGGELNIWASTQGAPYLVQYTATGFDIGLTTTANAGGGTLSGSGSDDILQGLQGDDFLSGGAGDDLLIDGQGSDTLTGGSGEDVFQMAPDGVLDVITDFVPGTDKLDLTRLPGLWDRDEIVVLPRSWGAELRYGDEVIEIRTASGQTLNRDDLLENSILETGRLAPTVTSGTIVGGTGGDDFIGGDANEDVMGQSGNDNLRGEDGNDTLSGGQGNDILSGGRSEDFLTGDEGDDTITGDAGFDTIEGGEGNDVLIGGDQADSLRGGNGDDRLQGDAGFDNLYGDNGNDTLIGGNTADRLHGGNGDDLLRGGTNFGITVDGLFGGAGNDSLYGEGGYDYLEGGSGNDFLDGGNQADNLYGGLGFDTLLGGNGLDRLFGGADDDIAYGGAGNDGLFGDAGNDYLDGGDGDDRFFGGTGNDSLIGGSGQDEIHGGAGFDTIIGGAGNDTMTGDFNADRFVFADGQGIDVIEDFDATNDFERIDLSAVSAIGSMSDLISNRMMQTGNDVLIDTGGGNSILLLNVDIGDLDALDFLF